MVRASARQNFDGDVVHRLEILTRQWCGTGRAELSTRNDPPVWCIPDGGLFCALCGELAKL